VIELLLNAENALALGLLDQAERTFRQVLDADPRNGIAAVGLSRVALERGDDATALELAQAALAIDPENATARRMINRMVEVARYRADAADAAGAAADSAADPPRPEAAASSAADAAGAPDATDAPDAANTAAPSLVVPADTTAAAPSVTMSTSAPSVPAPERPGILRRLLRRS
jgi:tetratricopeptide (TPR) repeat protein